MGGKVEERETEMCRVGEGRGGEGMRGRRLKKVHVVLSWVGLSQSQIGKPTSLYPYVADTLLEMQNMSRRLFFRQNIGHGHSTSSYKHFASFSQYSSLLLHYYGAGRRGMRTTRKMAMKTKMRRRQRAGVQIFFWKRDFQCWSAHFEPFEVVDFQ